MDEYETVLGKRGGGPEGHEPSSLCVRRVGVVELLESLEWVSPHFCKNGCLPIAVRFRGIFLQ